MSSSTRSARPVSLQLLGLCRKNYLVARRNLFLNVIRCLILPVLYILFVAEGQLFFNSPGNYGVGTLYRPIQTIPDTIGVKKLVFWDNSSSPTIARQLSEWVAADVPSAQIFWVNNRTQLTQTCPQNFNQVSNCYGAVLWLNLAPSTNQWSYQLRLDSGLVDTHVNNGRSSLERRHLPLQWAVDKAIFRYTFGEAAVPPTPQEVPYTQITQSERLELLRLSFVRGTREITALAFLLAFVGVVYHLTGLISTERENLTTQLMDVMGIGTQRRLLSWHLSLSGFYLPSWVLCSIVVMQLVFTQSNKAMVLFFHVFFGIALVSWTLFAASWFKRSQLSGIAVCIGTVVLAILAMVGKDSVGDVGVVVLSLIFPPMAFVFGYVVFANFERYSTGVDMVSRDGQQIGTMLALFLIMLIAGIVHFYLAVMVDHFVHGDGLRRPRRRQAVGVGSTNTQVPALRLRSLTKVFKPFSVKKKLPFTAVDCVDLVVPRGGIHCLLGSNGSGKSTTLGMVSGLLHPSSGVVEIDGHDRTLSRFPAGHISLCPQKNVLFDELTVIEHIELWAAMKNTAPTKEQILTLIDQCDLSTKAATRANVLSGGMKRKLQLAIAFCGNSQLILIDEVSSGVDPLARKKLHEIMLRNRGDKTQIITTHFLDEADVLSDYIAMLSHGKLVAEGTAIALKRQYGRGSILRLACHSDTVLPQKAIADYISNIMPEAQATAVSKVEMEVLLPTAQTDAVYRVLSAVEDARSEFGIESIDVSGPTLDDVFLTLMSSSEAGYSKASSVASSSVHLVEMTNLDKNAKTTMPGVPGAFGSAMSSTFDLCSTAAAELELSGGRPTNFREQIASVLRKRFMVLRTNPWPQVSSIVVGVLAIAVSLVFLTRPKYTAGCTARSFGHPNETLTYPFVKYPGETVLIGPSLQTYLRPYNNQISGVNPVIVDSPSYLLQQVTADHATLLAGGIYIDTSTNQASFAWWLIAGLFGGMSNLNLVSNVLYGNMLAAANPNAPASALNGFRINATYKGLDTPSYGQLANSLKYLVFAGVALCVIYSFAALYPTNERLRKVKALHYSNGLKPLSLHTAHLLFELPITLIVSALITIIYAAVVPGVVHEIGLFFVVLWLFGVTSTLLSFVVALFGKSGLASFAFATGIQAVWFLLYIVAYLLTLTYAPALSTQSWIKYEHFTMSLVPIPVASMARAIVVGLNMFSLACIGRNRSMARDFSNILLYGGPILYLILQAVLLFSFLVWYDSGKPLPWIRKRSAIAAEARPIATDATKEDSGIGAERLRIDSGHATDVLQVRHMSKRFGDLLAVDDVTFGVDRGQVVAALGPNSAGKSTLYSMIRGEVPADSGDAIIGGHSIRFACNAARSALGVCPQFDAIDTLTVRQHLTFYARVKGVAKDRIRRNVDSLIDAVSLTEYKDRMAAKLSGGNQRKLSLAIAMIGNPQVLLVDEASSGMDIGAKRQIWKTLNRFTPGRAVVLTTHSMEEADALSDRVVILAKRFLAVGQIDDLRRKYGEDAELSLIIEPPTASSKALDLASTAGNPISSSEWEKMTTVHERSVSRGEGADAVTTFLEHTFPGARRSSHSSTNGHLKYRIPARFTTRDVFAAMEGSKHDLHVSYYSIGRASLEEVFLRLVREHKVREEGYHEA